VMWKFLKDQFVKFLTPAGIMFRGAGGHRSRATNAYLAHDLHQILAHSALKGIPRTLPLQSRIYPHRP